MTQLMFRKLQNILFSPRLITTFGETLFRLFGKRIKLFDESLPKVILVIRLDDLGDQVLNSCFLREIRKNHPLTKILLLTKNTMMAYMKNCPYIDELIGIDISQPKGAIGPLVLFYRLMKLSARRFWPMSIDWVVNPRRHHDYYLSNLIGYLSGGKIRWGYRNTGSDQFLNRLGTADSNLHEVEHNLETIRWLGGKVSGHAIEVWVSDNDHRTARQVANSVGLESACKFIVFGVGAADPARRWAPERFAKLAQKLIAHKDIKVVVVGGSQDRVIAQIIANNNPTMIVDLTGRLSLSQSVALMFHGEFYVGNDSGPMHLACAAGIPVVEISMFPVEGPIGHANSPKHFGPWAVPFEIVQPQVAWDIQSITVEEVFKATMRLMKVIVPRQESICH